MWRWVRFGLVLGTTGLVLLSAAWAGEKKGVASAERDPAWFACESISDCTVAAGLCGSPTGVHVAHRAEYERWVQGRQVRIRCAGGIRVVHRATVACEQGVCSAGSAPETGAGSLRAGDDKGNCGDITECIVALGVCGAPVGIPAVRRKVFEKRVCRRAAAADCAHVSAPPTRAVLACERQRCLAGPLPESVAHPKRDQ